MAKKGIAFEELPADKHWLGKDALKNPDIIQLTLYFTGTKRKDPPLKI